MDSVGTVESANVSAISHIIQSKKRPEKNHQLVFPNIIATTYLTPVSFSLLSFFLIPLDS